MATTTFLAPRALAHGIPLPPGFRVQNDSLVYKQWRTSPHATTPPTTPTPPRPIAGFDFDETLTRRNETTEMFPGQVIRRLQTLSQRGYHVIVFTNETLDHLKSPIAKSNTLLRKLDRLEKFANQIGIDMAAYVATRHDEYRKPSSSEERGGIGMWTKATVLESADLTRSFYVGDADGGRSSFTDSDVQFARAVGIKFWLARTFFLLNEEAWLSQIGHEDSSAVTTTVPHKRVRSSDTVDPKPHTIGLTPPPCDFAVDPQVVSAAIANCTKRFLSTHPTFSIVLLVPNKKQEFDPALVGVDVISHGIVDLAHATRNYGCDVVAIALTKRGGGCDVGFDRLVKTHDADVTVGPPGCHPDLLTKIKAIVGRDMLLRAGSTIHINFGPSWSLHHLVGVYDNINFNPELGDNSSNTVPIESRQLMLEHFYDTALMACAAAVTTPTTATPVSIPPYIHPRERGTEPFRDASGLASFVRMPPSLQVLPWIYLNTDEFVIMYDAYPKAKYHLLVLARSSNAISSVWDLQHQHLDLVQRMYALGNRVIAKLASTHKFRFHMGFHALPSMTPLHMHIISGDFDSPWMKSNKHWNSFTRNELFVTCQDVETHLSGVTRMIRQDESLLKAMEKGAPNCVKCAWKSDSSAAFARHWKEAKHDEQ